MTKKQKEKVLQKIRKKDNMAYWDEIDGTVEAFIRELLKYSYPEAKIFFEQLDEDEEWNIEEDGDGEYIDEFWDVLADVRNYAIKKLERNFKAWFPYVDE